MVISWNIISQFEFICSIVKFHDLSKSLRSFVKLLTKFFCKIYRKSLKNLLLLFECAILYIFIQNFCLQSVNINIKKHRTECSTNLESSFLLLKTNWCVNLVCEKLHSSEIGLNKTSKKFLILETKP